MKFSLVICLYREDNSLYFMEAFESILNQSKTPNEIILVIDGPIGSDLINAVKKVQRSSAEVMIPFIIISLETNQGHGIARSKGLEKCSFPIVAIADSDDINHKHRFLKQIKYLELNPEISVIGAQVCEIDNKSRQVLGFKMVPCSSVELSSYIKKRCPLNQMTVMFRKSDVLSSGGYIDFYHNEDYFLWVRMYINGYKFANIPEVLVDARVDLEFYNRRGGIKYFLSEVRLQKYMLLHNVISMPLYFINVSIRLLVQVLIPSKVRGKLFKLFFRSKAHE
jgi:glycosyltransferase involved in cell wall biosynthesis